MITITGQTPSHKNSKQWTGKKLINNKLYLRWRRGAEIEVLQQCPEAYKDGLEVSMRFFVKDKRPRDLDNMMASVMDVLVAASAIRDDNCFVVYAVRGVFGGIDRLNPRAEVKIRYLRSSHG